MIILNSTVIEIPDVIVNLLPVWVLVALALAWGFKSYLSNFLSTIITSIMSYRKDKKTLQELQEEKDKLELELKKEKDILEAKLRSNIKDLKDQKIKQREKLIIEMDDIVSEKVENEIKCEKRIDELQKVVLLLGNNMKNLCTHTGIMMTLFVDDIEKKPKGFKKAYDSTIEMIEKLKLTDLTTITKK